ncbi:hypothetical protein SPE_0955 [Spiroplasma eriocheiris CCTCC M 207170]|nr:hypothetical protein SPE_0955 [Spiroplasma eriocheiris CCTCC M 207170]
MVGYENRVEVIDNNVWLSNKNEVIIFRKFNFLLKKLKCNLSIITKEVTDEKTSY